MPSDPEGVSPKSPEGVYYSIRGEKECSIRFTFGKKGCAANVMICQWSVGSSRMIFLDETGKVLEL